MSDQEIFVRLVDEGGDVWRPVRAVHIHDDIYTIVEQQYDRELETWQFAPGEDVVGEVIEASEGRILAATKRVTVDA
jgi:hypothetical protein